MNQDPLARMGEEIHRLILHANYIILRAGQLNDTRVGGR